MRTLIVVKMENINRWKIDVRYYTVPLQIFFCVFAVLSNKSNILCECDSLFDQTIPRTGIL